MRGVGKQERFLNRDGALEISDGYVLLSGGRVNAGEEGDDEQRKGGTKKRASPKKDSPLPCGSAYAPCC